MKGEFNFNDQIPDLHESMLKSEEYVIEEDIKQLINVGEVDTVY